MNRLLAWGCTLLCLCTQASVQIRGIDDPVFQHKVQEMHRQSKDLRDFRQNLEEAFPSKEVSVSSRRGVVEVTFRDISCVVSINVVDTQKKLSRTVMYQIKKAIKNTQKTGQSLCRYKVLGVCQQLAHTLHAELGYQEARVTPQFKRTKSGFAVDVVVVPGSQHVISSVNIKSTDRDLRADLERALYMRPMLFKVVPYNDVAIDTQRVYLQKRLEALGYRAAHVETVVKSMGRHKSSLTYAINPGAKYTISDLHWVGGWQLSVTQKVRLCLVKDAGKWATDRAIRLLQKSAETELQRAQPDARCVFDYAVDHENKSINLSFELRDPEYFMLRSVDVKGNTKTYKSAVARWSGVEPGDFVTDNHKLYKNNRAHFQDVVVSGHQDHRVLHVTERPDNDDVRTSANFSYNAYDGLDAGVSIDWPMSNFCGTGASTWYRLALKDTGCQLLLDVRYPAPFGLDATLFNTFDLQYLNTERLLYGIFRRGHASDMPSFVTFACKNESGISLPVNENLSIDYYLQMQYERYGLTWHSLSQNALERLSTAGLSKEALDIINGTNFKGMMQSYAQTGNRQVTIEIASIVDLVADRCGADDARKLRRIVSSIVGMPMFSHAVFSQDVFPKDMQALITLGNRFVYKDVDDELDPASGYKCMIDVSGTSGTSAFGRLLISGVRYTKVKDRVITVRAKVGKSILNKYWVNNFKGRDFPCRLVDYEPVSYVASPYKVGGSAGYNFSASLPVFANRWVNASVFWDAGCIWNSGLDPIGYGMMGDKISLNFTPGTSIVVRTPIPMLPPLTVSIGLPQIFGDGRHSSHANLLGIHVGFSLGGVM